MIFKNAFLVSNNTLAIEVLNGAKLLQTAKEAFSSLPFCSSTFSDTSFRWLPIGIYNPLSAFVRLWSNISGS